MSVHAEVVSFPRSLSTVVSVRQIFPKQLDIKCMVWLMGEFHLLTYKNLFKSQHVGSGIR